MPISLHCRRLAAAVFTGCAVAVVTLATPIGFGALNSAQAQVSAEFQAALEPYGEWRQHPRWGQVWVPLDRPRSWRPYTYGHWVYTDDWGWYWVSDDDEADWGWVTYHYGRWVNDRRTGWFWVPGEEWAPAWVDWRRGDNAVGWAPLPPTEMAEEVQYDDDPTYWVFVQPRYMMAPRLRTYVVPQQRTTVFIQNTVIVNRTVRLDRERERIAVNPGIAPNIVAAVTRSAVPTYRVQPRVVVGTQGVQGAVAVRPQDLGRRGAPGQRGERPAPSRVQVVVQQTTNVIQPAASVPKPEPLSRDERGGRLGSHPPRAAQGATVAPAPAQQQQQPSQQHPAQQQQQQRPAAAPAQTPPPPASAPPAAQPRPEPPRPGAPQDRQEQRQERRDQHPPVSAPPAATPQAQHPQQPPAPTPQAQPPQQRRDERPPQARPEHPPAPQTPPPPAPGARPAAPPPAAHPPAPPPAAQRPAAPPPAAHPPAQPVAQPPAPPPAAHPPAPPPAARPAPPAPPAARPAPPPPPAAAARPPAPPAAHPPAAARPAAPPPKPGEKPQEEKK